jgi:hypothetical protein
MRKLACCALMCVVVVAKGASASVIWRGDYETGDTSQWTGIEGISSRLTIVQSPLRQGKYALRAELHQGDIASSGTRNELQLAGLPEVEGNDHWYAWSTMFPADFPAPSTWQVFTQWHHSGCCGSPPLEFDVLGETIQISHLGTQIIWKTPLVRGVWHDFVIHVYWSSSNGYIEFWYDGQQALKKTALQTLNPGEYNYLKQGLYRDASIAPIGVVYHDGMVMGTSMADVAPQLGTPPILPPDAGPSPEPQPDAGTPVADPGQPDAGMQDVSSPPPAQPAIKTSGLPGITGCSSSGAGSLAVFGLLAAALAFRSRARRRRTPPR